MKKYSAVYITIPIVLIFIVLSIFKPAQMISPGALSKSHSELNNKCFSCHNAFKSVNSSKCTYCHKVSDIGKKNTKGQPLKQNKISFHNQLNEQDCLACHKEHNGEKMMFTNNFEHNLINIDNRQNCTGCHAKPTDKTHQIEQQNCTSCHQFKSWAVTDFDHEILFFKNKELKNNCLECHKAPTDNLHVDLRENCVSCHSYSVWKPATFNHDTFFRFDRKHNVSCKTCHSIGNYKQYTCYNCHEHSQSKIRQEHLEEGITDYTDCISCHKSANEHEAKWLWRKNAKQYKQHKNEYDDD